MTILEEKGVLGLRFGVSLVEAMTCNGIGQKCQVGINRVVPVRIPRVSLEGGEAVGW